MIIHLHFQCTQITVNNILTSTGLSNDIFRLPMWLDPQFWMADRCTSSLKEIKTLIQYFANPLQPAKKKTYIYPEWLSLQTTKHRSNTCNSKKYGRKSLYTNIEDFQICLLTELAMMTSSWNSPVEKVFSTLQTILTDQQLSMAHKTMEDCSLIARNKNA